MKLEFYASIFLLFVRETKAVYKIVAVHCPALFAAINNYCHGILSFVSSIYYYATTAFAGGFFYINNCLFSIQYITTCINATPMPGGAQTALPHVNKPQL